MLPKLSSPQGVSKIMRIFYVASCEGTSLMRQCWASATVASNMLHSSSPYKFLESDAWLLTTWSWVRFPQTAPTVVAKFSYVQSRAEPCCVGRVCGPLSGSKAWREPSRDGWARPRVSWEWPQVGPGVLSLDSGVMGCTCGAVAGNRWMKKALLNNPNAPEMSDGYGPRQTTTVKANDAEEWTSSI
ncbi:hypothetical protein FNV43_RR14818 [Rhamnella rubrinervis]|uniref:Uncharacterized protein n=1 Tax=Rhamnella rubrinervis TaxID=2594499 RepID=A0A8K0H414_9ROSA|nr:hypothetical protein FNV43_RR14818 [Rhamnella rubrinervis]